MKTSKTNVHDSLIEVTFNMTKEDIVPFLAKAADSLSANLKMDGFRPGKVPGEIVAKQFGENVVFEEAVVMFIKESYPKYIEENKIEVVSSPELEITKMVVNEEAECKIKVQIVPSVDLKNYKEKAKEALKEKKEIQVTDADIDTTLNWLRESRSEFKELERGIENGDIVDASYKIFVDDQERPDLASENYKFIVGKEPVFSTFNTDLMGLKKEDQKDVQVVFPDDYSIEELRNKNALAKMTINKIMKRELPELNDDFAKKLGKFETVEQLKNNIRDGIQKEKEIQEEERVRLLILEKIKADVSVELPEVLVERETKNTFEDVKNKIAEMGMEFTEYLNQIKKTEEDVKKDIAVEAKNKVMNALILREIIRLEKIEPTQEEIDQRAQDIINEISIQNPGAKNIDINMIKNYSAEILRNEKVFDLLLKVE